MYSEALNKLFGLVLFCLVAGCAPTVSSVPQVTDPVTVYLVDFETHANLMLPRPEGGYAEFTYADWYYAVEGNRGIYASLQALAWPSQGALGRRIWSEPVSPEDIQKHTGAARVHSFEVEHRKARALFQRLNSRFETQRSDGTKYSVYRMLYVKDHEPYSLLHTCNSEVSQWLHELDLK